jgi:hypothetical protein
LEKRMNAERIGDSAGLRRLALIVLLLNVLSSVLFIATVKRPVYDDPNNLPDVHRYASEGVSLDTIRQHRNPTGPTSFLWMAAAVRILGGDELRDARLAVLASWVLLGSGILLWGAKSSSPQLWYFALLVTLVFPHTLTASATVLTEGPALLFATLGIFFWLKSVSESLPSPRFFFLSIVAGLLMGLAITCRQYYLALLLAAILFACFQWKRTYAVKDSHRTLLIFLSILAATLPVVLLVAIWRGLSSPAMVAATSYGSWKSAIGPNFFRPFVAAFYLAVYLLPLTFPAMAHLPKRRRTAAVLFATAASIAIALAGPEFLQPGPLNSFIRTAARIPGGASSVLFAIAALAIYNAVAVCSLLWEQPKTLASCAPGIFSLLVLVFFVAEQFGVGGNLPFYDRYVLQVAPFLGIIAFSILPRLTPLRLLALAALSALSHVMLWRFAFSG